LYIVTNVLTLTLRHPLSWLQKGGSTVDRRLYPSGKFARKALVSVRTLRYYDKEGLLSPTEYSEAGYRLYSDEDLVNLQQILALKFLGFALDEIKVFIKRGPRSLERVLSQQKEMMSEKRNQLDTIIQAIDETAKLVRSGENNWESLVKVIQVIQMGQNQEWVKKYIPEDSLEKMQELSDASYSDEAKAKMATWGEWTEEDQVRVNAQWTEVWDAARKLTAENADAAGAEAQDMATKYNNLISAFTRGDADIAAGLNKWWQNHEALPQDQKPIPYPITAQEQEFLNKALAAHRK
jgi:DNA-binding transcriptional MerR regulator